MFSYNERVPYYRYAATLQQLSDIYDVWQADRDPWLEPDTICLWIIPVLHLLNFPTRSIRQTVRQIRDEHGRATRPDIKIEMYGIDFGIIEAKKASTDLSSPHGYPHSHSPIDQALCYFDQRASRFAIATNGLEWIVFRKASADEYQKHSCHYEAIRTNLEFTLENRMPELIDEFILNFDYYQLMQGKWPQHGNKFQKKVQFQRNSGPVSVLMHDFSWDNKYPRC